MKKGSIKKKLLLIISLGVLIPLLTLMVVSAFKFKDYSLQVAKSDAIILANEYGNDIKQKLSAVFIAANTFADIYSSNINDDGGTIDFSVEKIHKMQKKFLQENEQTLVVYTDFLPRKFVLPSGELNKSTVMIGDVNTGGDFSVWEVWNYEFKSDVIGTLKDNKGIIFTDPYEDEVAGNKVMMISYGKAIKDKDEIIGVLGVDFSVEWIQQYIKEASIFDGQADICIVSSNGTIVGNNNRVELVGTDVQELDNCSETEKTFFNTSELQIIHEDELFKFYIPISLSENGQLWHVRISVAQKAVLKDSLFQLILRMSFALSLVIIALGISFFYLNKIVKRISALATSAKRIAKGNLATDFSDMGNDELRELSDSLQSMISRFTNVIGSIKKTTEELYNSGSNLSNVAIKLSEGASEQASSTEEVSASMEEMTANIEQNAENSKIADEIARKSATGIEISSKNVIQTSKSMGEIANKISVIGDIAFQTNILALNAAVEAARAGIHGKGFGVVAAEVGKLAENSKKAAAEIDELTNKSFVIAKKSGDLLEQISPDINKTAQLVQDITNSSLEQKAGTEQINNAIQQLNKVTQENAGSAELLASNVEALSALADKLNKLIGFFKTEKKEKLRPQKKRNPEKRIRKEKSQKLEEKKQDNSNENKHNDKQSEGFSFNLDKDKTKDDEFEKF